MPPDLRQTSFETSISRGPADSGVSRGSVKSASAFRFELVRVADSDSDIVAPRTILSDHSISISIDIRAGFFFVNSQLDVAQMTRSAIALVALALLNAVLGECAFCVIVF